MRRALALVLLALLVAPTVEAHLSGARPILQRGQLPRIVDLRPADPGVDLHLELESDPLRHIVIHTIDPTEGRFSMEYREDASIARDRFHATWTFQRLLEFRDANVDGYFQPATDTVVRSWRFEHYDWRRTSIDTVQLEDVVGKSTIWDGNLSGGPTMRIQVAFAGKDFTDEGAVVRPQDVIVYYDVTNLPERSVGGLYAIEIDVATRDDTVLDLWEVNDTPTALLADAFLRRAFLVWGGEGFLDGREQRLDATLDDLGTVEGDHTARLAIHMPTLDRSMRFVMVTGIEYGSESPRSESPAPAWLALGAIALAVGLASRRR